MGFLLLVKLTPYRPANPHPHAPSAHGAAAATLRSRITSSCPPAPARRKRWRQRGGGPRRIFEDHAVRHLQRLPVLVRDEAGLDEEAVERPQRHRERQQRRWPAGSACGGEGWLSRVPPTAATALPAPPRLPAPRCPAGPPGAPYSTDRRLRSRTASGLRARARASSPPAASIRGGAPPAAAHAQPGGGTAGTSFRSL